MLNTDWAGCVCTAVWKEIKPSPHHAKQLVVPNEKSRHTERHTKPKADCTQLLPLQEKRSFVSLRNYVHIFHLTVC